MSRGINPTVLCVLFLFSLLSAAMFSPALAGTNPAGKWVGEVKTPDGEKTEIVLTLDQQGGDWNGTLDDPLLGTTGLTNLRVTDTSIAFAFKPADAPFPLHFTGSYIAGDDRVTGTFSLHGNSRFVKFKRAPGSEVTALSTEADPAVPARIRHDFKLAVTGRLGYWSAVHVVKDETYNINTLTAGASALDGALRWFVMDGFNFFVRGYRGGQTFDEKTLTGNAYLKLDGFEFGGTGYFGNLMMRDSNFNPFLTAGLGKTQWALTGDGRGSYVLSSDLENFEGTDWSTFFGLGTEYGLSQRMAIEFEVIWRYFMTQDDAKWEDTDNVWSNTHVWALSAGLTVGFW